MPERFSVRIETIDHGPGVWKTARVHIFELVGTDVRQIGSYDRNHAGWCGSTFAPFTQDGNWYALYAPDYTATRVMALPSCRDLGGEEHHTNGFCPVDYYVPHDEPAVVKAGDGGRFGFVAGCIWGDDSSWKIQFLDLSGVSSGVLVRKEMFGYIEMPRDDSRLVDYISLSEYSKEFPRVEITARIAFDLAQGTRVDPFA